MDNVLNASHQPFIMVLIVLLMLNMNIIVDYIKIVCHKVLNVLHILLKVFVNNVQNKLLMLMEFAA
jgi:hypothetical protein